MAIEFKTGNILDSTEDIIGHQTNTLGIMGAGLAKQIKDKNPLMYESYRLYCKNHSWEELMGNCFIIVSDNSNQLIANIFGQNKIGNYTRQTSYPALQNGLIFLEQYAKSKNYSVSLPDHLGSGLAGGDWDVVLSMIKHIFENSEVKCVIYKLEQ